jgi:hypothetical protein
MEEKYYKFVIAILSVGLVCSLFLSTNFYITRFYDGKIEGYKEGLEDGKNTWMFLFYYVPPLKYERKYGLEKLEAELRGLTWVREWKAGVFDCSEMSAFLERYLEINGWHTYIAVGNSPIGAGKHSWLIVEVYSGQYIPVEATTIEIVYPTSPFYDKYFRYDRVFDTINEALDYSPTQFDWWNVTEGG